LFYKRKGFLFLRFQIRCQSFPLSAYLAIITLDEIGFPELSGAIRM